MLLYVQILSFQTSVTEVEGTLNYGEAADAILVKVSRKYQYMILSCEPPKYSNRS